MTAAAHRPTGMHRGIVPVLLLVALGSLTVSAKAPPPGDGAPKAVPAELQPLAYLAGHCWEGPLPDFVGRSQGYGAVNVTHCFRWVLEGRVLRDTLHIPGQTPEVRGETTYYWDTARRQLRYIFWSVGPSYSYGTVRVAGNRLVFDDEELYGSNGLIRYDTTWTQTAPDRFVQNRQRLEKNGTWTSGPESTFVRKPLK